MGWAFRTGTANGSPGLAEFHRAGSSARNKTVQPLGGGPAGSGSGGTIFGSGPFSFFFRLVLRARWHVGWPRLRDCFGGRRLVLDLLDGLGLDILLRFSRTPRTFMLSKLHQATEKRGADEHTAATEQSEQAQSAEQDPQRPARSGYSHGLSPGIDVVQPRPRSIAQLFQPRLQGSPLLRRDAGEDALNVGLVAGGAVGHAGIKIAVVAAARAGPIHGHRRQLLADGRWTARHPPQRLAQHLDDVPGRAAHAQVGVDRDPVGMDAQHHSGTDAAELEMKFNATKVEVQE